MKKFLLLTLLTVTLQTAFSQAKFAGVSYKVKTLTENVAASPSKAYYYYNVDSTGASHDTTYLTLPVGYAGAAYLISNSTNYVVYVTPYSGEKILGVTTPAQIAIKGSNEFVFTDSWLGWLKR